MALSVADLFRRAFPGMIYCTEVGNNAPPVSPASGDWVVVGTAGSGAFSGQSNDIARYNGSSWSFVDPESGQRAFSVATRTVYGYDGSAWVALLVIPAAFTTEDAQDAVGAMVDTTLEYVDGTPLLRRAALTGHVTAPAGSNETTIPSNTIASTMIQGGAVTNAKIRDGAGLSVIGVAGNATAQVADIVAASDGQILRRNGTSIGFGALGANTVSAANSNFADASMAALAGLTPAADRLPYYTSSSAAALATLTPFIRTLLDDTDAVTARATLGVTIGAAINDLRLTGVTATPVMTSDSASLGTIYLTPFKGNRISLYNGTTWDLLTTAEVSLVLSGRTSGTPFDVFAYNNAGTVTLEFTDWTNATTRATALARQDGVWCKSGTLTRRYLGTCVPNAATTFPWITEGDVNSSGGNTPVKLGLWNADNRVRVSCRLRDSGSSHSYSTATTRAWNNSTNARFEFVAGLQEEQFDARLWFISNNSSSAARISGFGIDSTTVFSGIPAYTAGADTFLGAGGLHYQSAVGSHYVAWLERPYSGTVTWFGIGDGSTALQSGAEGTWMC